MKTNRFVVVAAVAVLSANVLGALDFVGTGSSAGGGGTWTLSPPAFGTTVGTGNGDARWNFGNATTSGDFTYNGTAGNPNAITTLDILGGTSGRGIMIGNSTSPGNTSSLTIASGGIVVLTGGANSGVTVGAPGGTTGQHNAVLNLSGGNLTVTGTATAFSEMDLNLRGGPSQSAIVNVNAGSTLNVNEIQCVDDSFTAEASGTTATLNINSGGIVILSRVRNNDPTTTPSIFNLNVNGGTIRVNNDSIGASGFGNNFIASTVTAFTIQAGGLTVDTNGNDFSINEAMVDGGGGGGVTKNGLGTLRFLGITNTYTGSTIVNAGRIEIDSASSTASNISIQNGATLSGEGSTSGSLSLANGSTVRFDPTTAGFFTVGGTINALGTVSIVPTTPPVGTGLVVMQAAGGFGATPLSAFSIASRGSLSYQNAGTQLVFDSGVGNLLWKGGNTTSPSFWDINTTANNFTLGGIDDFFLAGDNITFDDTALSSVISVREAVLPGTVTFNNSTKSYSIEGASIAAVSVTKSGGAPVVIGSPITTGAIAINAGTLQLGTTTAAVSSGGTVTVNAGTTLIVANDDTVNFGQLTATSLSGDGSLIKNGPGEYRINSSSITYTGATTVNAGLLTVVSNVDSTFTSTIGGAGSFEKAGSGVMQFNLSNTYAGETRVLGAGAIIADAASDLGAAGGGVVVAGTGDGNTTGPSLVLVDGMNLTESSSIRGAGAGATTLDAVLGFDAITSRGAIQSGRGDNTISGSITLTGEARIGTQDNANLTITGTIGEVTPTVVILRPGSGSTITLSSTGSTISSVQTFGGTVKTGVANALPVAGLLRVGTGTLDLNGFSQSVNGIIAGNLGGAGSITNNGAAPVTLTSNIIPNLATPLTRTFAGIISDGASTLAFAKTGGDTQVLSGANTYTGTTTIDGGTLRVVGAAQNPLLAGAGGTDLRSGILVFDYTVGTDPSATILSLLAAGAPSDFATGQIRSSTATGARGIGYTNDTTAQLFTLMPALYGDATLSGVVDFDDLLVLAQNYNTPSGATWSSGDFTYNGAVDFDDLLKLAQNYGASLSVSQLSQIDDSQFAADFALAMSMVPEPSSLVLVASLGLAARRRR